MGSLLDLAPLSTVIDPLNHTMMFGHDTKGNLTTITNVLNKTDHHGQCLRREKYLVFAQTHRV
jgi:hypothetical protein